MVQCEGIPPLGTVVHDRRALLGNLVVGDIFHSSALSGASLICLVTAVTDTTIQARTVTHQICLEFDRVTGVAEWNAAKEWPGEGHADELVLCTIDSVAPLPVDIHNVMVLLDRKYRLKHLWDGVGLSDAEKSALLFIYSYYRANPI